MAQVIGTPPPPSNNPTTPSVNDLKPRLFREPKSRFHYLCFLHYPHETPNIITYKGHILGGHYTTLIQILDLLSNIWMALMYRVPNTETSIKKCLIICLSDTKDVSFCMLPVFGCPEFRLCLFFLLIRGR